MQKKIIITGFGGQGVILAGRIVGKAAAIFDRLESSLVQSYGPESRGGACSVQVTIADEQIYYPYINVPDILVCMSQAGYDKYMDIITENTILIIDQDLIKLNTPVDCYAIPATRLAEEMGLKPADFLAIGDSLNDIQMLKTAGIGITVANAHPDTKAVARYVSGKEYGEGFMEAIHAAHERAKALK